MSGLCSGLERTSFPPTAWRHLQTKRCATTAVQDGDHGAAPRSKNVDCLVVDEASAEHGGVASATALAPTTTTAVASCGHDSIELLLARGVGVCENPVR